ncbi:MAG: ABC transporter permease [Trebonia sp.]
MNARILPGTLLGAARNEYLMHIRRWPLWCLPAGVLAILLATGGLGFGTARPDPASMTRLVGQQAIGVNLLVLVVIGALLADRWVRDRQLGVEELLFATPASPVSRLWGKYLGVLAASASPLLVVWAVLAARLAIHYGDPSVAGTAARAYLVLVLPGLAFVAAFGLVFPRLLGVRLYQVLFIGYWFWGNLVPQHVMPTLSGTWLTPIGKYADAGLFAHSSHSMLLTGGGSMGAAYGSIALLAGVTVLLLTGFGLAERRRLR